MSSVPDICEKVYGPAELFDDDIAKKYEEEYATNPGHVRAVRDLASRIKPQSTVLDIGCGTGRPTAQLLQELGHRVTGVDISKSMLALARKNVPEATFTECDMRKFEPDVEGYDAIACFFALFQQPRQRIQTMLFKFARWLKPGGWLVIMTIPYENIGSGYADRSRMDDLEVVEYGLLYKWLGRLQWENSLRRVEWISRVAAAGFDLETVFDEHYEHGTSNIIEKHLYLFARRVKEPWFGPYPNLKHQIDFAIRSSTSWFALFQTYLTRVMKEHVQSLSSGHRILVVLPERGGEMFGEPDERIETTTIPQIETSSRSLRSIYSKILVLWCLNESKDITQLCKTLAKISLPTGGVIVLSQASPECEILHLINHICSSIVEEEKIIHHGKVLHQAAHAFRTMDNVQISFTPKQYVIPLRNIGDNPRDIAVVLTDLYYLGHPKYEVLLNMMEEHVALMLKHDDLELNLNSNTVTISPRFGLMF